MSGFDAKKHVIVLGMPRCGTTFLYYNIAKHPSFYVPVIKEIDYFSHGYKKGNQHYLDYFQNRQASQVSFDISPHYFGNEECLARIKDYDPNIKIILGVRDIEGFLRSFYANACKVFGVQDGNIDEFVSAGYQVGHLKEGDFPLDISYKKRISEIVQMFEGRLLIYSYDLLASDPLSLLKDIEKFIEVDSFYNKDNIIEKKINSSVRVFIPILGLRKYIWAQKLAAVFPRVSMLIRRCIVFIEEKLSHTVSVKKVDTDDMLKEKFAADEKYIRNLFSEKQIHIM